MRSGLTSDTLWTTDRGDDRIWIYMIILMLQKTMIRNAKEYIQIGIDAEDYYRIKDAKKI